MIQSGAITGVTPAQLVGQCYQWSRREPAIAVATLDSVTRSLLREKFLDRQRVFFAVDTVRDKQQIVGQVVSRLSPTLQCANGRPLGMLGFFAALNRAEPVCELLRTATGWLREQGAECIVGPMDGDTWHSYRLNNGPFDEPAFLMEPTNPSWYESIWTSAGFEPLDHYHSRVVHDVNGACEATRPAWQTAIDNGYRFRTLDINQFDEQLRIIYNLSRRSFVDNFLYDEISESEFLEMFRPSKAAADPRLVVFAEDKSGTPVGFLFSVVDYAVGVPDPELGQAVWIVAQVEQQSQETINDIQQMMQEIDTPCDNVVLVFNPLPVDPRHNSKIDYDALREQLQAIE